jgi:exosortase
MWKDCLFLGSIDFIRTPLMTASRAIGSLTRKTLWFGGYLVACFAVFWPPLRDLLHLSLSEDTYSHILLVPFITAGLVLMNRHLLPRSAAGSPRAGAIVFFSGLLLFGLGWQFGYLLAAGKPLAFAILPLIFLVWAGFLFFYGAGAFHSLQFPLYMLLLAVPLPKSVVDVLIEWLRLGSSEVAYWLFRATATPVFRQGFIFAVPGVTIDVAPECSGIRSAIALLITCLLAGYLFLRTKWARFALLVATLPVLVIKNGIRIVTLTLLATHVDPSFLTGRFHHQGGFVFFIIGLLILWPVLLWLQAREAKSGNSGSIPPRPVSGAPRTPSATALP